MPQLVLVPFPIVMLPVNAGLVPVNNSHADTTLLDVITRKFPEPVSAPFQKRKPFCVSMVPPFAPMLIAGLLTVAVALLAAVDVRKVPPLIFNVALVPNG